MAALKTNEGVDTLEKAKLQVQTISLKVRLFTNNHAPVLADTLASYTQCVLAGYADVALTPGSWTISTVGGVATCTYPAITFSFSANAGGTTIYGYVVYDNTGTKSLWAELFGTSFPVPSAGASLTLNLTDTGS